MHATAWLLSLTNAQNNVARMIVGFPPGGIDVIARVVSFTGSTCTQHNPMIPDGHDGLRSFVAMLRKDFTQAHSVIKRAWATDDYVFLLVHNKRSPDIRGRRIADIFRMENGKLVEHWDVVQDIPEEAHNANTMF